MKSSTANACFMSFGTDPQTDVAVLGSGSVKIAPADDPFISTFAGSSFAIAMIEHGVSNELTLYAAPIEAANSAKVPWTAICDVDDDVTGLTVHGDELYLLTHKQAPRFKVIRTSLSHPDLKKAEILIGEGESVVTNVAAAEDGLYVPWTADWGGSLGSPTAPMPGKRQFHFRWKALSPSIVLSPTCPVRSLS